MLGELSTGAEASEPCDSTSSPPHCLPGLEKQASQAVCGAAAALVGRALCRAAAATARLARHSARQRSRAARRSAAARLSCFHISMW